MHQQYKDLVFQTEDFEKEGLQVNSSLKGRDLEIQKRQALFNKQLSKVFHLGGDIESKAFQEFLSWQRLAAHACCLSEIFAARQNHKADSEGFSSEEDLPEKEILGTEIDILSKSNEQKVWKVVNLLSKFNQI